jgi:hypothetical protein
MAHDVFHLKFATTSFLPALADPLAFIYPTAVLGQDIRWLEQYVLAPAHSGSSASTSARR